MQYLYIGTSPRYLKGYGGLIMPNDSVNLTTLQIVEIERGGRTRLDQDTNFVAVGGGGGSGGFTFIGSGDPSAGLGAVKDTYWDSTNKMGWVKDADGWNLH